MSQKLMRIRSVIRCAWLVLLVGATASCGEVVRSSRAPVILLVNSLLGAPGNSPQSLGSPLISSVINLVTSPDPCNTANPCRVVFNDVGSVVLAVVMKDATLTPTTNNQVTISRYRVEYKRADGRNTPGVDVPYPFDGAASLTVAAGGTGTVAFEIVRVDAKKESPLVQLKTNPIVLNTIAYVTFYGRDSVGNDVSVTGSIFVDFGNFSPGS